MNNSGIRLWVAESAMATMKQLAEEHYPYETGGMLLGYEADNGEGVITTLIGPGPKAKHGRYSFVPDATYQQTVLETHFIKTNGQETYLGDWHTHPHGTFSLSFMDKKTLARIAETPTSGTPHPIMAILGGQSSAWVLGAVRFLGVTPRLFFNDYSLTSLTPTTFQPADMNCRAKNVSPP